METKKGKVLGQNRALSLFHNSHKNVGYFTLAPWALKSSLPRWMKSWPLAIRLALSVERLEEIWSREVETLMRLKKVIISSI